MAHAQIHGYTVYDDGTVIGPRGKPLAPVPNRCGYGRITLCHDGKRPLVFVHRLVAEAFLPKVEGKECVNHKDGDKRNNRIDNLEWVTHAENHKHAYQIGRKGSNCNKNGRVSGSKNSMSKLTEAQALAIKALVAKGEPQRSVATRFGVNQALVWRIAHGKSWRHV